MASSNRGFGASLGIGREVTWGTAVARTLWLRLASHGLIRKRKKTPVPHLMDLGQAAANSRHHYIESDFVEGPLSIPMAYDDATLAICLQLLGANSTTGTNPYTHTMTLAQPGQTGLTLEAISGTPASGGGNMAEVFEGCLFTSGTFTFEAGKVAMLDLNVIGETSGGLASAGTPTYSSGGEYIKHNHIGALTYNSVARKVRRMTIEVNRNLERNHELGSLFTSRPVEGPISVSGEVTTNWQQSDWDTDYVGDVQDDMTFTFTSGAKSLACTLHNVVLEEVNRPVSSAGAITQTAKFRAYADASDLGIQLAFTNTNSSATAN